MKNFFKVIAAVILGLLFSGGIDLEDLKFKKNIRKLKKEKWFKELCDDGRYYESIFQNEGLKDYLTEERIVEKILHNKEEKERFLSFISRKY
ncbi:hypothetical protein V7201_17770 [Bacillus sp. JJ1122]|uniref:hypothetical protein n=1 Tax=Bacillus sp. JJ1122 TaxID=3122951 RepID=UPI002FFE8756